MPWRPRPSDRFYRFIVRTGLALRWLFRIRVIVTGQEHLPAPEPRGRTSAAQPARPARLPRPRGSGPGRRRRDHALRLPRLRLRRTAAVAAQPGPSCASWSPRAPPTTGLPGPPSAPPGTSWSATRSGAHAYDAAVARLREGEYIAILPEAGVSRSFRVRECKTGAVRMAAEAGVPVIPVSVWGAHRLMTRRHGFSPARAWRAPVRIHVGEPMAAGPGPGRPAATEALRAALQAGIDAGIAGLPPATGAGRLVDAGGTGRRRAHRGGTAAAGRGRRSAARRRPAPISPVSAIVLTKLHRVQNRTQWRGTPLWQTQS